MYRMAHIHLGETLRLIRIDEGVGMGLIILAVYYVCIGS